jgi:hypothetical protein
LNGSAEVYDISGKQLFSKHFEKETSIDLSNYSNGIYILKIVGDDRIVKYSHKLVKQ